MEAIDLRAIVIIRHRCLESLPCGGAKKKHCIDLVLLCNQALVRKQA